MKRLDSRVPYYYQIKEELLHLIAEGRFPPGSRFPSEQALTREYDLSRPTIRQALGELVQEGYLVRQQGRGTFVSEPLIVDNAQVFTTLDELHFRASVHHTRLIRCDVVIPSPAAVHDLDLGPEERVYEVTTERSNDREKLAVRTSQVPERLAPDLPAHLSAMSTGTDVYSVLHQVYHLSPVGAAQTFRAVPASGSDADRLAIRRGLPVMLWEGLIYAPHGLKMARVRTVFRGDRFSFAIRQGRHWTGSPMPDNTVGVGILDTIDGRIW